MQKICSLVRDLLPLYIDDLVGEDSTEIIEDHLGKCSSCRQQYEAMGADVKSEPTTLPNIKKPFLRLKRFYIIRTVLVVLVLAILAVPVYFGFNALRGRGVTFTSFTAARYANSAFDALKDGDYSLAAEYFDDSERSHAFMHTLEALQQQGVNITSALAPWSTFSLSGGYTSGQVIARMEDKGERYDIYFLVGYCQGELTPRNIMLVNKPLSSNRMNILFSHNEWPEWAHELNEVLGPHDSRVARLVERSILRGLDGVTIGQELDRDLWQLPMLNAVPIDQSEAVLIYFTTHAGTINRYFEETVLPELEKQAKAQGVTLVMVVWPQTGNILVYSDLDFPVFLANEDYITSENIKGFPSLRLYSKDHKLLWEQLGLRGNEDVHYFDALWGLLN